MRKGLKKSAAFLLAVCMIFSLFAGVPMSVKADEEPLNGLVTIWAEWNEGFPGLPVDPEVYCKVLEIGPKKTGIVAFATMEGDSLTPYTGELSIKNEEGTAASSDGTIQKHMEDGVAVEGIYDVKFGVESGIYTICSDDDSVTVTIGEIQEGFFSSNEISVENYIDEQRLVYTESSNNEFYFAYKTNPCEGLTYSIETSDGEPVLYLNEEVFADGSATITKTESATAGFEVYKITLGKDFAYADYGNFYKELGIKLILTASEVGTEINSELKKIGLEWKQEGLVLAWPDDWNDDEPFVTGETEYGKYLELNPKITHVLYFGTMGDGDIPVPYTEGLTIKKVEGNEESIITTDEITIDPHVCEVWNEGSEEPVEEECEGFYDVYLTGNASGTYRVYGGTSFITVKIVEPECGFYSTSTINTENYINEQCLEYSETSNRTFYFAIKKDEGITRTIVRQDDGTLFDSDNNKDEVRFEQVNTSDENHDVYKITLGDKFEAAWNNQDFFNVKLNTAPADGEPYENEFTVELCLNPVGLVAIRPDWDDENNCAVYSHIPENDRSIWKSFGMDQTQILYFGVRDADGSITPIEDMSAVTISGNANIQKYEQNNAVPGFYEITLLDYGKEYTFTYNGSSFRIYNTTPSSSGGGTTTGGGTTSGGSTSDSNTTTETKPDGSTVETTTETKSDGTKVETITETKTDGTKVETSTETKTDGSKVETSTETKTDGSKTENIVETAADGSVKTTETVTKADGSATKTEKESETNTKGKEVAVTTTTKTDTTGAVTSVTEKSVIEKSSATTSTTVTVKKNGEGTITSASANVAKKVNSGNKATVSASIVSQIIEAAGTESVSVTMTVKDSEGKTKYKVKVEAENLQAGEELFIYKLNTKTGEYTMVNAKSYEVSESGNVSVSMTKKATYELVTAEDAAQIDKQIKSTIKPKKSSADVKPGKSTDFALSSKANEDNIKSITYTTSKKSVATVSKDGKITAKGKGTVTVTAKVTLKNGTTKTIKMTIKVK